MSEMAALLVPDPPAGEVGEQASVLNRPQFPATFPREDHASYDRAPVVSAVHDASGQFQGSANRTGRRPTS